jgi:DNA-binding response OmpR family regulator
VIYMIKKIKNIKVLIVEDDKDICEMYAMTFMKKGFTVYTAADGRMAIQKYQNKDPDIILLDIMMPNVSGYQVLKEVRKNVKKYVPVIMLTNLDAADFVKEARIDDIDAYLIKSHNSPSEIVAKTVEILKLNRLIDEAIEF